MNPSPIPQISLSDSEWHLILELLQRERTDLPSEIHHTRTPEVHDKLHRRLDMVNALLDRLRDAGVGR